jgi:hypothetical protein
MNLGNDNVQIGSRSFCASSWFNSLYFKPLNGLLPELILENSSRLDIIEIGKKTVLSAILKESILKEETRPFVMFTGTHEIKNLEKLFVTKKHKKILQEQEVAFYFFEPLTYYTYPFLGFNRFGENLKINNKPHEIETIRCFELDSISKWIEENNIKNLKVYCNDYKSNKDLQKIYSNVKLLTLDLYAEWHAARNLICGPIKKSNKFYKELPDSKRIIKKFWCGAWRYDASRHFITAYLASQDLTLKNNVSFYFKISNAEFKKRLWFNWKEFEFKHHELSKKLLEGNTLLQDQVPLSIEIDHPAMLGEDALDPSEAEVGKNTRDIMNPVNSYRESFCAIVQESRVTQPWPSISEKILYAIKNHRPFLLVGAPGTLSMLKEMGFKTFDQWWDESYDDITNNTDRLTKICETIDYINSFSVDELKSMYNNMIDILIHNENNLSQLPTFYNKINKSL